MTPRRAVMRYHGGKWRVAPRIIPLMPPHRRYVEPYGGGAGVLLRKERAVAEIYNDLDGEVVSFFRVLRDPDSAALLVEALRLTPFARDEFRAAYEPCDDPVEAARRLAIRSFMGFGSNAHASQEKGHRSTGFRANAHRSGTTPAVDWANYPAALEAVISRWRGVIVENRDAFELIARHDRPDTLFYIDPPYVPATRSLGNSYCLRGKYRHELDDDDHARLLGAIADVRGMVVLSGYATELYDAALRGWRRIERAAFADGARPRVEVLWISPNAAAAGGSGGPLFDERGAA